MMRRVILESPYAGNIDRNIVYARAAVRDSLLRGEAPIASHLLYTQPRILNDNDPDERRHGIDAGLAWRTSAEATVAYVDLGISGGMEYGIIAANDYGVPVEYRSLKWSENVKLQDIWFIRNPRHWGLKIETIGDIRFITVGCFEFWMWK